MDGFDLDVAIAYDFYKRFILDYAAGKKEIYERYGFAVQGSIGSKDWEVFVAILMKDRASPGVGADLQRHEVKSASSDGSFEYQYHKVHGLDKLKGDKSVDHVFISRSDDYSAISVWWVSKETLAPIFDAWEPELRTNYETAARQRFRKSITYRFVRENGIRLMETAAGRLVYPILNPA